MSESESGGQYEAREAGRCHDLQNFVNHSKDLRFNSNDSEDPLVDFNQESDAILEFKRILKFIESCNFNVQFSIFLKQIQTGGTF